MNRQLLIGSIIGAVAVTAVGAVAGLQMVDSGKYAEVLAVRSVTKTVSVPKEECHDQLVDVATPVKDPQQIAGTVAGECVVLAETKDHLNWELISRCAEKSKGEVKKVLTEAYDEVGEQEAEHLYHTMGWCRELWIDSLGMKAVLPPPEEVKDVKTAIGASRAEQASLESR